MISSSGASGAVLDGLVPGLGAGLVLEARRAVQVEEEETEAATVGRRLGGQLFAPAQEGCSQGQAHSQRPQ